MDELKQDGIDLDAIRDEDVSVVRQAMQDAMNTHGPYSFPAQGRHIAEALFVAGWRSPAVVAGLVAEVESITQMNADWQVEYRKAQDRADHWRREFERQAAELDRWRAAVREAGIDYPLSPVAVGDLSAMAVGRLADLQQANRRLGAVAALADEWTCNCGGPSPEGRHEMHCDSYYGDRLRAALGPVSGAVEGAGRDRESLAWVLLLGKWGGEDAREHLEDMVAKYADTYEPWQEALRAADMVIAANWSPSPVAVHEQEVRADGARPLTGVPFNALLELAAEYDEEARLCNSRQPTRARALSDAARDLRGAVRSARQVGLAARTSGVTE